MGVGLLVGVWVARYLGPEQFGQINYASAFVGLFGVMAGLGLNSIVVRDIIREPENVNTTIGTAFVLEILGSLVAVALTVSTMAWLRPDDTLTKTMVVILGIGLVFKSTEVVKYWFESQVQSRYTVWIENGVFIITTGVKIVMLLQQATLMAFVWITFADSALVAVGLLAMYAKRGGHLSAWQPRIARAKSLLKDSWPIILSNIAIMIYMRIDQVMIGQMLGEKSVGIYSAAVRISEIWYFIPVAIASSMFPSIIEAKKQCEMQYNQRLQKLSDILVIMALCMAILTTLCSEWLVVLLFGKNYIEAGNVLSILVWSGLFVAIGVATSNWYLIEGLQKTQFLRTLLGATLNIALNIFFIPMYGVIGAALSTLISYGVAAYIADTFSKQTRILFLLKTRSIFQNSILIGVRQ